MEHIEIIQNVIAVAALLLIMVGLLRLKKTLKRRYACACQNPFFDE